MSRPLFIPLKAHHFDAFARGEKTVEMRRLGQRWNIRTCPPGREVILSRGYGKEQRLHGTITQLTVAWGCALDAAEQAAMRECYGTADMGVCLIHIKLREAA